MTALEAHLVSAKHRSRAGFIWSICGREELLSAFSGVSCLGEMGGKMYFWCSLATKIQFQNKDKYSRFLSAAKRSLHLSENLASCRKKRCSDGKSPLVGIDQALGLADVSFAWPRKQFPSFPQGV